MISEILRTEIEAFASDFRAKSRLLRSAKEGQLSHAIVERYLASIRFLLQHTPPYLTLARSAAVASGHLQLASYFERKLGDEAGHVEWAEADLERLTDVSGVRGPRKPEPAVVDLMRDVRKTIEQDPFLYLPYILFTEYFTVLMGPEWLSALQAHCGVPMEAMTAVSQHVELDRHHVEDGCREIDELVKDEKLHALLRASLQRTMERFSVFCDELCDVAA
jgi:pyrroloquinoline quinone (PQQ) biosynthesis protein C